MAARSRRREVAPAGLAGAKVDGGGSTRLATMRDTVKRLVERGARTTPGKHLLHAATRPELSSERFSEVSRGPPPSRGSRISRSCSRAASSTTASHRSASTRRRSCSASSVVSAAPASSRSGGSRAEARSSWPLRCRPGSTVASYDLPRPAAVTTSRAPVSTASSSTPSSGTTSRAGVELRGRGLDARSSCRRRARSPLRRRGSQVRGRRPRHRAVVAALRPGGHLVAPRRGGHRRVRERVPGHHASGGGVPRGEGLRRARDEGTMAHLVRQA